MRPLHRFPFILPVEIFNLTGEIKLNAPLWPTVCPSEFIEIVVKVIKCPSHESYLYSALWFSLIHTAAYLRPAESWLHRPGKTTFSHRNRRLLGALYPQNPIQNASWIVGLSLLSFIQYLKLVFNASTISFSITIILLLFRERPKEGPATVVTFVISGDDNLPTRLESSNNAMI